MDRYRVVSMVDDVMSLVGVYGSCRYEARGANKADNKEEELKWLRRGDQLHFMICDILSDIHIEVMKEPNEK